MRTRFGAFLKRTYATEYTPRHSRLAGDLASYRPLLNKRIAESGSENKQWAIQAIVLLDQAAKFLSVMKIDEGWKTFHTSKRLVVNGMTDDEKLAVTRELLTETSKINNWRKDAVKGILMPDGKFPQTPPESDVIMRAMELKDDHYNNLYYRNTLSRAMFQLLFLLLALCIIGIMIFFGVQLNRYGDHWSEYLSIAALITGVLLFAFLGSITSAILFTRYSSQISRLNEIGSNTIITLSKVFVGASFSVFIFMFLRSSFAESVKLFNFTISQPVDYFAIAFVSGFSERLAQKAIESIIGKEKPSE